MSVRIRGYVDPPWSNACDSPNCPNPGLDLGFHINLANSLGLGVQSVILANHSNFTRAIDEFVADSDEADVFSEQISLETLGPILKRLPDFTVSTTINEDRMVLIAKAKPPLSASRNLLVAICDPRIWIALVGMYGCVWLAKLALDIFGVRGPRKFSWAKAAWFLALGILLSIYATFLAVTLGAESVPSNVVGSKEDLSGKLAARKCKLVVPEAYTGEFSMIGYFMKGVSGGSKSKSERQMRLAYSNNPPLVVRDPFYMLKKIHDSRAEECLIGLWYLSSSIVYRQKACGLQVFTLPDLPKHPFGALVRKKTRYGAALDALLKTRDDAGAVYERYIHRRSLETASAQSCREGLGGGSLAPLRLGQLLDIFWLFLTLSAASALLVALEFFARYFVAPLISKKALISSGRSIGLP